MTTNSTWLVLCAGIVLLMVMPVSAQITPDSTLNTTVSQSGDNFTIINGNRVGNNLFHSFSQFSVPSNGSAFFNNAADVQNIFSRVTGGSVSNIDGLIKANGSANLFLLNPSGIIFGQNASLNTGGSFVGTTAQSIKFADGVEFSAVNSATVPLLTMSIPVGLQMGRNASAITVQGIGNHLIDVTGFGQASTINSPAGLQAGTNQTLALIGGAVNFSGGVISTKSSGHLEVGSISNGLVRLTATPTGWAGDYSAVSQFNDIHLAQESMLNASGSNGSIQLQGANISLTEGSALFLQTVGNQSSGGITVNATGSLSLTGNTENGQLGSLIQSNNLATGQIGDITVSAAQLSLQDGARIISRTRTQADGANINVNVSGMTKITGFNRNNPAIFTTIATFSVASGQGGNITVSTGNLGILDSAELIALAIGSGKTGTVQINAAEQVTIAGFNPMAFDNSSLATNTQGSGNASRATINAARLVIQDGGSLGSTTTASGSAGDVVINASESIDIARRVTQVNAIGLPARIFSNAESPDAASQAAFKIPPIVTGNAGSLIINTPVLRMTDGGSVTVKNGGTGSAGNVEIDAKSIFLNNHSSVTAEAQLGEGGNIFLQGNSLILRHGSLISATSGGVGNGGNITINAPIIGGFENSDIVANAVKGRGGNINITTQGIFGLKYRPQLTSEGDITASSQFGVNGTVQVNTIGVDPNSGLVKLPANVTDSSQQIASGCSANQGSRFVATGRGGVPQNPMQEVRSDRTWSDIRDISAYRKTGEITAQISPSPEVLVQATSWRRNAQGKIELVTAQSHTSMQPSLTCAAIPKSSI
ncbi:MAG: filamentous hemagglutinin N-terminal domain-containing protein [Nostoc sp.]|uniref:two-partner secretion domain-containing protein n=1 Tax=Nostoc sp. TaxID=1180 RepID=UPI002FF4D7EB